MPDLSDVPSYQQLTNSRADEGMASSIVCGLEALRPCDAAFIVLGDMPKIAPDLYARLAARLEEADIIQPVHNGQPGHPVLFAAKAFDELKALTGDEGARSLISSGRYRVLRPDVDDTGIHFDIDVAG